MLQVENSGALAAFEQGAILDAKQRYKCGGQGVFAPPYYFENFSLAQDWSFRSALLLFTGNWQLFFQAKATWSCKPCTGCKKCDCHATIAISGVISKTYTFAPVNSNWATDILFFNPWLQHTYNISTSFSDVVSDISTIPCK
jgi:hypothetical protein